METSTPRRGRKRAPQRAVPQSIRRSGKPLFFGWGAHLTHHEREQVKERIAAVIGIVIALAVIGILANGWIQDNIVKAGQNAAAESKPVATVGKTLITKGWYDAAVKLQKVNVNNQISQYQQVISQDQASPSKKLKGEAAALQQIVSQLQSQLSSAPTQAYQQVIDNAVMEQKGPSVGLRFGAAAQAKYLNNIILNQFNGPQKFAISANDQGISTNNFKAYFLMVGRAQRMQRLLAAKVSKTQFQVHVRHILIGPATTEKATLGKSKYAKLVATDLALARHVQSLLQHGGSWSALARKYSTDPGSKDKGGDYGWVGATTYDSYVPQYKDAALHQKIGPVDIIHSQFGYHVFQVLGRGQRPLSASAFAQAKQSALQTWLSAQEAAKGYVKRLITPTASLPAGLGSTGLPGGTLPSPSGGTAGGSAPTGGTGSGGSSGKSSKSGHKK